MHRAALTLCLVCLCCAGRPDIVSDICRHGGASPSYDQFLQELRGLLSSPRIALTTAGTSHQGRPIPLVIIRDPDVPIEETVRVFLIGRQHGTEASGTVTCLALARHFAAATGEMEATLLRQLSFVMIPVANPDGMSAGRRGNAAGVDLNRHWCEDVQPEIRAVKGAVAKYQPHALVDMHELPASSSKPAFRDNFIQTIGRDQRLAPDLTADCAVTSTRLASWMGQCGMPLNIYYDSAGENLRLCHRYFGLKHGIPSYLFEVKCGSNRSLVQRVRFHVLGTLVVANYALHRYYEPSGEPAAPEPVQVAAAPPAEEEPAAAPGITLTSPKQEQVARGQLPIEAAVTAVPSGAYVSFAVDGRLKSLTNRAPHQYLLDTTSVSDGRHEVVVELCDAAGRTLGAARSVITVDNSMAAAE